LADQGVPDRICEMLTLLESARPMMELKCCHFEWCIERRGVVSEGQAEGFREIEHGMPGCAPYRRWLGRYQAVAEF
jgi:hypothetical protein